MFCEKRGSGVAQQGELVNSKSQITSSKSIQKASRLEKIKNPIVDLNLF
jgi:hypothetical protein